MPAGRPPKYKTPEEMQEKIDEYFNNLPTKVIMVGDKERETPIITITGLCYHLGFECRQSFYDYEKREGFSYTIKRARLLIEHDYELELKLGNNNSGNIFALKNFGWKDKQEIESTNTHEFKGKKPTRSELLAIINEETSG